MPYFCRSGHPVVTTGRFHNFIGPFLSLEDVIDRLQITGQDLYDGYG